MLLHLLSNVYLRISSIQFSGSQCDGIGTPPDTARLSLAEIAAHITTAGSSRFSCASAEQLRSMLKSPTDALGELRRILTKKGSTVAQKMDRCVATVAHSAQSMRAACECVMRGGRTTAAAAGVASVASVAASTSTITSNVAGVGVVSGAVGGGGGIGGAGVTGPGVGTLGETELNCLCQQVRCPSI